VGVGVNKEEEDFGAEVEEEEDLERVVFLVAEVVEEEEVEVVARNSRYC
jgi:hypothetical protein